MEKNNKAIWDTYVPYRNFELGFQYNLLLGFFSMFETTKVSNDYLKLRTAISISSIKRIIKLLSIIGLIDVTYIKRTRRVISLNPMNMELFTKDINGYLKNQYQSMFKKQMEQIDKMSSEELVNEMNRYIIHHSNLFSLNQDKVTVSQDLAQGEPSTKLTESRTRSTVSQVRSTVSHIKNPLQSCENSSYENPVKNPVEKPISTQSILDDILNSIN